MKLFFDGYKFRIEPVPPLWMNGSIAHELRSLGFCYGKREFGKDGIWWTEDKATAAAALKRFPYLGNDARKLLGKQLSALEQSRAVASDLDIPRPDGMEFFKFQVAGIEYAIEHKRTIIGDEMGLGKTCQALGVANFTDSQGILIVCPATLRPNWRIEAGMWLKTPHDIHVVNGGKDPCRWADDTGGLWVHPPCVIVNYDILHVPRIKQALLSRKWDLLVLDECFPYWTPVLTDRGWLPIGAIVQDELDVMVASVNFSGNEIEFKPITRRIASSSNELVRIKHGLGELVCTANHKIWTEEDGYVQAGKLHRQTLRMVRTPDSLLAQPFLQQELFGQMAMDRQAEDYSTESVRVESVEVYQQAGKSRTSGSGSGDSVYNLEIEGNHNYFANGILVSNCHNVKTPGARRSIHCLGGEHKGTMTRGLVDVADRVLFLSGTPIPNRPIEIYPIMRVCMPHHADRFGNMVPFMSRQQFIRRFCNGEPNGASHLDELQTMLRSNCMVRRRKSEVLKDLPPKFRQVITLAPEGEAAQAVHDEMLQYGKMRERHHKLKADVQEKKAAGDQAAYNEAVKGLSGAKMEMLAELAVLRKRTALAKVAYVIESARDMLEAQGIEKLVIFAYHHDVIDKLVEGLSDFGTVVITGKTPMRDRQKSVEQFQNDPKCRVFIGNMKAAGEGITLTAASRVLFAELDWTPKTIVQAEDRLHRIGQQDSVLVIHIILDGSLDQKLTRALIRKQAIADKSLDLTQLDAAIDPLELGD